jgi:Glycosyltransferase
MKKALLVATTTGFFTNFELNNIEILKNLGYEIEVAGNANINYGYKSVERLNETGIRVHQVDFDRFPLSQKNNQAYKEIKKIINDYKPDLIHCHTPVAGFLTRFAARKNNIKIIYTAHGFHFFKGNNYIKNLVFRTLEKCAAKYTDVLITINDEDYEAAKKFKLKRDGKVYKINGVGIDVEKFKNVQIDREAQRKELGLEEDDVMLLSVGELSVRKNHRIVIKALAELKNLEIHYFIAGVGELENYLKDLAKKSNVNLHLLGYRTDIAELLKAADVFCFPSLQEGLPVALMEAMAAGLPIIASKIRGNVDLIDESNLFPPFDSEALAKILKEKKYAPYAEREILEKIDYKEINKKMLSIYKGGEV